MNARTPQPRTYYIVAGALFVLLALTVALAYIPLGRLSLVISLIIAGAKAALVVLFFMHIRYSHRVATIFASVGVIWLIIMIGLTLNDYLTRS